MIFYNSRWIVPTGVHDLISPELHLGNKSGMNFNSNRVQIVLTLAQLRYDPTVHGSMSPGAISTPGLVLDALVDLSYNGPNFLKSLINLAIQLLPFIAFLYILGTHLSFLSNI